MGLDSEVLAVNDLQDKLFGWAGANNEYLAKNKHFFSKTHILKKMLLNKHLTAARNIKY